jgi:hypothetical protein
LLVDKAGIKAMPTIITEAIYIGWNALLSFLGHLEKHKELLTLGVVTVGGVFGIWRWTVDQKWRHVRTDVLAGNCEQVPLPP